MFGPFCDDVRQGVIYRYVCVYVYIYIYIHTYIHIYICVYIYVYLYIYIHTYTHAYVYDLWDPASFGIRFDICIVFAVGLIYGGLLPGSKESC